MRAKRGKMASAKIDGRVVVYLDPDVHSLVENKKASRQVNPPSPEHTPASTIAVYERFEFHQCEENAFLRQLLDRAIRQLATERERHDLFQREALHRFSAVADGGKT
jgi:hypothetical protein